MKNGLDFIVDLNGQPHLVVLAGALVPLPPNAVALEALSGMILCATEGSQEIRPVAHLHAEFIKGATIDEAVDAAVDRFRDAMRQGLIQIKAQAESRA